MTKHLRNTAIVIHTARLILRELASDALHAGIWAWEKVRR